MRRPHSVAVAASAWLTLATALLLASSAQAQQQPDFSKVEIRTNALAPDFHTLDGQGGTISVLSGPDGVLIVDSQFAPLTDKIVAALVAQGKSVDEVVAAKPTTEFDARVVQGAQSADRFVRWLYAELKAGH